MLRYTNAFHSHSLLNQSSTEFAISDRYQHHSGSNANLLGRTMQQGNCAARQREVYKRIGSLEDAIDFVIREISKGTTAV